MDRCGGVLVQRDVDAVLGEAENEAILDFQVLAGDELDAVQSGADSVNPHITQGHHIVRAGSHNNSIGSGNQYGPNLPSATIQSNGLCDGYSAESTWIQSINFTARGGL